jgi:hypothetical protein
MTEKLPVSSQEMIREVQNVFENRRREALEKSGFDEWFSQFEAQLQAGLIPSLTFEEGRLCAERFGNLKELQPSQPTRTTETPIMTAITADLKEVFGDLIEEEISSLVVEKLMPLRGIEITPETEPNKFLAIATKNILRDVVAVARAFQMTDQEIKDLHPEVKREASLRNLNFSLLFRGLKGEARTEGLCAEEMHQEHIWMVRGLRDIPPGGLQAIGEFIDKKTTS